MNENISAIVLAGGNSSRMNGINKQLLSINGIPVVIKSALAFQQFPAVKQIIIVARPDMIADIIRLCEEFGVSKLTTVCGGGETRACSVRNGLAFVSENCDYLAIHDGARPLISQRLIADAYAGAINYGGAAPCVPVKDTIKLETNGFVEKTPDRSRLFAAQTPQIIRKDLYISALEKLSKEEKMLVTDDCSVLELAGYPVVITNGDYANMKITTPDDVGIATALCEVGAAHQLSPSEKGTTINMNFRIGNGYDVHRLVPNRKLILCGIEIPYELGLLGHSDADVAVHAVMDAILGAMALGDIGKLFPDNDIAYKDADSCKLLDKVVEIMDSKDCKIGNIDLIIIAEKPKLAKYILQMRESLAFHLHTDLENVSVKATTEEGLGLAGNGIGANCCCIIEKN